jgi:hypothetical protein
MIGSVALQFLSVDAITYWTGMDAMGHPLAHMSLDFLSIPGEHVVLSMLGSFSDVNFSWLH